MTDHPQRLRTADPHEALRLAQENAKIFGTGWLRIDYMRSGTAAARGGFSYEVVDPISVRVMLPTRMGDGRIR